MKIIEFEKRANVTRDTIRYYEKIGLIKPPARGINGYRDYNKDHIAEVLFIKQGQEIGFSLKDIKMGLESLREKGRLCGEYKSELKMQRQKLEDKIKEFKESIKSIDKMLKN
jgi:MerR family copper efflux transcriptional regulator